MGDIIKMSSLPKIMVFAPHQDDELIMAGGRIIQAAKKGQEVCIVFIILPKNKAVANTRKEEALKVAQKLGVPMENIIFLKNYAVDLSREKKIKQNFRKIARLIKLKRPDEIYIPAFEGGHFDHDATNYIVVNALKKSGIKAKLYEAPCYSYSSFFADMLRQIFAFQPRFFFLKSVPVLRLDLDSSELEFKKELFRIYSSQNPKFLIKKFCFKDKFRECPDYDYLHPPFDIKKTNYSHYEKRWEKIFGALK